MTGSLIISWVLVGLSLVLIRLGWGTRRSVALAGWALALVSLVMLACSDGAWGMATGFVTGMIVALGIVLHAGWRSPAKRHGTIRQADAVVLRRGYHGVGRRLTVFAMVVPVAFAAALWLAFTVQALLRRGAPLDADSVALTLFLQPVTWTALMSWQMTLSRPVRMAFPPLIIAALGAVLWSMS